METQPTTEWPLTKIIFGISVASGYVVLAWAFWYMFRLAFETY